MYANLYGSPNRSQVTSTLNGARLVLNSTTPFTPALVRSSLTQVSNPEEIYASRVQGRQIRLENPAQPSKTRQQLQQKRARKKAARVKRKWAPSAEHEGLWKLSTSEAKYDLFLPLHHLWLGYISELLALQPPLSTSTSHAMPNAAAMHAKLVKADFHGCIMTVRQSKNPCLVGLSGIVIYESENAFRLITKADKLKLVPKQSTVFAFGVPLYSILVATESDASCATGLTGKETVLDRAHLEFELYGNQFRFRSTDRASRKFKHKETIEL